MKNRNFSERNKVKPYTVVVLQMIILGLGNSVEQNFKIHAKIYSYYIVFVAVPISVYGEVVAFLHLKEYVYRLEILIFIVYATIPCFTLLVTNIYRNSWEKIYEIVAEVEYANAKYFLVCDERVRKWMIALKGIIICYGMHATTSILGALLTSGKFGSPFSLIIPAIYPWRIDNIYLYFLTILFQTILLIPVSYIIIASTFTPIFLLVIAKVHHSIILSKVQKLDDLWKESKFVCREHEMELNRNRAVKFKIMDEFYNTRMTSQLHNIFKYHQYLCKYMKTAKVVITPIINILISTNFLSSTLVLSYLLRGGISAINIIFVLHLSISWNYLFLLSYIGEEFSYIYLSISNKLYNTMWYEQAIKYRKDFHIFQFICQKAFTINVLGGFIVNLEYTKTIASKLYSFLQVISRILKK